MEVGGSLQAMLQICHLGKENRKEEGLAKEEPWTVAQLRKVWPGERGVPRSKSPSGRVAYHALGGYVNTPPRSVIGWEPAAGRVASAWPQPTTVLRQEGM